MAFKSRRIICLAVLICTCAISQVHAKKEVGTIILQNGTRYEMVTYTVNRVFYSIKIELDDEEINVSFSDIDAIFNSEGEESTSMILGRRGQKESDEAWVSERSEEYREAHKRLWNVAVSFFGGYDVPFGDYYDGTKGNLSFGANFCIAFTDQIAGRLSVSRAGIDIDQMIGSGIVPGITILEDNTKLSAMRVLFGVEYYSPMNREKENRSFYYIQSTLGVIVHKFSGDFVFRDEFDGLVYQGILDDSETKFTTSIGGGIVPLLSPSVGLDLSLDLDGVWTKVYYTNGSEGVGIKGFVLDLHAGLLFFL